ncbi:MAG: sulfatase-like hydrolase/transferase [Candidatus Sumerlaeota bacterium]
MTKKKQVVFIMTDTQRKDMLTCYEDKGLQTPNLDRLAAEGIRFDRTYCCQPVCGPARAALFTGTFPHSNGSWGNSMPLGETVKTLGQRLSDAGVHTAYIGKWHLDGGDYFGMGRCPEGWDADYWYDMRNYLEELTEDERRISRQAQTNRQGIEADFTFAHRCSNRAADFIEKHQDEDFFLVVSYDEPHGPFLCPEPYASMYKDYAFPKTPGFYDYLEDKPDYQKQWSNGFYTQTPEEKEQHEIRNPDYFGCHSFVDSEIGRVIDAVDQFASDAMVIYTADHGDMLGHHSIWSKGPAAYDDIANIPFLVRWPKTAPAASTTAQPVSHIDLTPTMLDFFGGEISPILEGKSLLPCFRDPSEQVNDAVFIEFGRYEIDHDGFGSFQPLRAIYDGRYKLSINLMSSDELYDLEEDPYELKNLIDSAEHAKIRDRLHDRIIDWMNETRDPFRGHYWLNRAWRHDTPEPSWDFTGYTRQREESTRYEPRQFDYDTGLEMTEAVRKKS